MKQTALLIGATGGIGAAIAKKISQTHDLFITSTREDALLQMKKDLKVEGTVFDLVSKKEAELIAQVLEKKQKIDCLIIASGITSDALCMRLSEEAWDKTIEINLSSAFRIIKQASKNMIKQPAAKIILISSVVARMGNVGQVAYAASKAGLEGMVRALAREFASRNVTVNAIAPGFIETKMTENLDAEEIKKRIPLQRLGKPEDVAQGVAFLASPGAEYITGHTLEINGGLWMI